jgi:archaellum component FlaG (FlaF/FlaG flagellin family)
MLSVVITALLLCVMLLIIASLAIGALRERARYQRLLASHMQSQGPEQSASFDGQTAVVLYMQDGMVLDGKKPAPPPVFSLPSSWYTRRRTLVSLGFLVMLLLTLFAQGALADGTLQNLGKSLNFFSQFQAQSTNVYTPVQPLPDTASARIVRVDSAARNQYYTDYQWRTWSFSSCSGISMEEVMNAYGRHLIAADVLQEELNLGVWDVSLGLLKEQGIAMTTNYYGFNTDASHARTLQDIINIANKGFPVIVSVRDGYYFPGGHIFVVRGGDSQYVYIVDSSLANFQRMTHPMFIGMWQGFSAILTPR